ncbi:MAG: rubrerythrin [Paludibacter sp.]|nr:rubrerythrin [Paludibacter sp.]
MIDEELVRCKPCGYVMKESELGDVCPACGLPRNVFEPYRERVSANRLFILALDIHPIAIHLSQTFVALIPLLSVFHLILPDFFPEIVNPVIEFSIFMLPLSLLLSFFSGLLDGITRFKTLRTPLLKSKIIYSSMILILGFSMWASELTNQSHWVTLIISFIALACAVKLGLLGKHLIDVILPGAYVRRKKKTTKYAPKTKSV